SERAAMRKFIMIETEQIDRRAPHIDRRHQRQLRDALRRIRHFREIRLPDPAAAPWTRRGHVKCALAGENSSDGAGLLGAEWKEERALGHALPYFDEKAVRGSRTVE